jgi:hypothetical protein
MDEEDLKSDLECVTQARALTAGDSLVAVLGRLDAVAKEADLPQRLQHYLAQRSYTKALAWLDHPEMPHHP